MKTKDSKGWKLYQELLKEDREITRRMVMDREISEEMGRCRDDFRMEEILDSIPDELFEVMA